MFTFSPIDRANEQLIKAAGDGTVADVERALAAGAKISIRDSDNANMLVHAALYNNRYEVSRYFADQGLGFTDKCSNGLTALHGFAGFGWTDLMRRAIEAGASVNAVADGGESPLWYAVTQGTPEAIILLVENGADLRKMHPTHGSLLHSARAENCAVLVDLGLAVDTVGPGGNTPLHCAAERNDPAKIAELVSMGAALECLSDWDFTPLLVAASMGNADAVSALLDAGAAPDARMEDLSLERACRDHPGLRPVVDAFRARSVLRSATSRANQARKRGSPV